MIHTSFIDYELSFLPLYGGYKNWFRIRYEHRNVTEIKRITTQIMINSRGEVSQRSIPTLFFLN